MLLHSAAYELQILCSALYINNFRLVLAAAPGQRCCALKIRLKVRGVLRYICHTVDTQYVTF